MNSAITKVVKWAQSQQWAVEDDANGYTRFYNRQGGLYRSVSGDAQQRVPPDAGPLGRAEEGWPAVATAEQEGTKGAAQKER